MQSPVLERLVGGAVLAGLILLLALAIGPREGVRMPHEEGSQSPVAHVALQPAEPGIAAGPDEDRREPGPRAAARWPPPGSAPRAPQWGVQVGSFAERGNAARLSDWCREQGYGVKILAATQESNALHRVRVGPFATRDDARAAVAQLALRGRNSFVTDWDEQAP